MAKDTLSLRELEVFREIAQSQSVREAARRLGVQAPYVSKTLADLERKIGSRLFERSPHGTLLSARGEDLLEHAGRIFEDFDAIESWRAGLGAPQKRVLAFGAASFLNAHIMPYALGALEKSLQFRLVDLQPDQVTQLGVRGIFDLALHVNKADWPATWVSQKVGTLVWRLCVRKGHPLGKSAKLKTLLAYPFVVPVYQNSQGAYRGNDQFPVPLSHRTVGSETSTAETALAVVSCSDQIAFLPAPLLHGRSGFRVLQCPDVNMVSRDVYLSARSDLVTQKNYEALLRQVGRVLSERQVIS